MNENSREYDVKKLQENVGEKIVPMFFNRNFGLATKSEIESMMFNCYLNNKIEVGEDFSDRTLSLELGVPETKIRTLKRVCFARYQDKFNFPKFLQIISNKDNDLMFFEISSNETEVLCKITIKEIIYRDELLAQLTNSNIHFDNKIGTNYIEILLSDAIDFFEVDDLHNSIDDLVDDLKKIKSEESFNSFLDDMIQDIPFVSNTAKGFIKLVRN